MMTILVVFFGGFKSSQPDMDKWLDSARKQRSDVQFEAFPYPDIRKAGDKDAVHGFRQFDDAIKKIEVSCWQHIHRWPFERLRDCERGELASPRGPQQQYAGGPRRVCAIRRPKEGGNRSSLVG